MKHLKLSAALGLALAGLLAAGSASAGTTTGQINLSATLNNFCQIQVDDSLEQFGDISGFPRIVNTDNAGVQVQCNVGTQWSLTGDGGQNFGVTTGDARTAKNSPSWNGLNSRAMISASGDSLLAYNIYLDTAETLPFGTVTTGFNNPANGTGTGLWQNVPLTYDLEQLYLSPTGTYSDVVNLTLTY